MRKTIYSIMTAASLLVSVTGCNDWLDLLPNNEQVSDDYWKSKEDVEAVVASGYVYLRKCVPSMLVWGELRGGSLSTRSIDNAGKIQNFDILPTNKNCDYASFYQVIGMANSVLDYAPGVTSIDDTYYESILNSHLCEAYFLRAYSYLTLVRNFKEVPLVVNAYVNDKSSFSLAKSSEEEIIARIKSDVRAALATGAAKSYYETEWATCGRVTKWALYALMADVALWNHDYDECLAYCDSILNPTDLRHPAFIDNTARWFEIFYPGNSVESIFELNWDQSYGSDNNSNGFAGRFPLTATSDAYIPTEGAMALMCNEVMELESTGMSPDGRMGRMLMSTFVCGTTNDQNKSYKTANTYFIYKYRGTDVEDVGNLRTSNDANFILYRVAEIMLMKAEALVMKGEEHYEEAVKLINKIRNRAGISDFMDLSEVAETADEPSLLTEILNQRELEFMAEGKRWYDLLRLARYDNGENMYKARAISIICDRNRTTSSIRIQTVLADDYAWYLPLPDADIKSNRLLIQNPYYETTN